MGRDDTVEAQSLTHHEGVIERGLETFMDVGRALLAIRAGRLYRAKHGTFEAYCRERWGMERAHAYRLIDGAQVVDRLSPIGDTPATESQARPLTKLPADQQADAWQEAVATAPGGKLTLLSLRRPTRSCAARPGRRCSGGPLLGGRKTAWSAGGHAAAFECAWCRLRLLL